MSHFPENRFLFTLQPPAEVECSSRSTCFICPHSLCEPRTEAIWLGTSTPYCSCWTRWILILLLTIFFHCVKAAVTGPGSKWVLSWEICISRSGPKVGFVNFTDVDLELKIYKVWEAVATFSASAADFQCGLEVPFIPCLCWPSFREAMSFYVWARDLGAIFNAWNPMLTEEQIDDCMVNSQQASHLSFLSRTPP